MRKKPPSPNEHQVAGSSSDLIEGRQPILEALKAKRPVHKIFLASDAERRGAITYILAMAKEARIPVEHVDRRALYRMSQTGHSQGVIAQTAAHAYVDLDALLAESRRRTEAPLYVLLDGVEDPHNLGAILRTADAAGVHGAVIPARRAAGLTPAVARASAGAVEYVPVARVPNLHQAMERLGKENVWTVGLDPAGTKDYTQADYRQPTAIVIGAEGRGLSQLVREKCDVLVSIPMKGRIASLNASVAAALVMYEAMRQRRAPPASA